jgi:hypothetical protein
MCYCSTEDFNIALKGALSRNHFGDKPSLLRVMNLDTVKPVAQGFE